MSVPGTPPSPDEVRSFFTRWLDGSNAGAWDTVAAMMHPRIELIDPMLPTAARGRTASLERAKAQYAPFPDGRVTMVGSPFVSLDRPEIAYRWRFEGTHLRRIDPPGFSPTGREVAVDGSSVLELRDGQVLRVALFFDTPRGVCIHGRHLYPNAHASGRNEAALRQADRSALGRSVDLCSEHEHRHRRRQIVVQRGDRLLVERRTVLG